MTAMKDFNLRTMLRNRLPISKSKEFLAWAKSYCPYSDLHHILGSNRVKLNDFLVCPMPHEIHMKIENGIEVHGYSFEEQLAIAIEILIKYAQYQEQNN
jgi:hypothetical protein